MKKTLAACGLIIAVTACSAEPTVEDPYADLADATLLVRFEANPDLETGQCNPNVHYALRTTEEFILLNANYEVVDQNLTGSGVSLSNADGNGVATASAELNMFEAYPMACSELSVRAQDLKCRTEADDQTDICPSVVYEGTEMFASFRGLPDY
ncbi:MAG: hypothetical protein AAGL99_05510 [Pseudomonadota bacterium]